MKALCLSGGSAKGAFQTGAILYLLGKKKIKYDIMAGVSVGAINAAAIGMFPDGKELEAAEYLRDMWISIDASKIYKRWWPFGRWHGLWKASLFDSSPLHHLVKSNIDIGRIRSSGKKVYCGTVNLTTGKYTVFNSEQNDFVDAVIASASFPGLFTPVQIGDHLYTDGGSKEISPISIAINQGCTEIDLVMTSPEVRIKKFINNPKTVDVINRSFDLSTEKIMSNDLEKAIMYNKLASTGLTDKKEIKINVIRPSFNLLEDLLDFDPEKIRKMMEIGYQEAKNRYG